MTDFNKQIVASGDDNFSQGSSFFTGTSEDPFGKNPSTVYDASFRFTNITIPKDVIVSSAIIRFTAYTNASGTACNVNIYVEDSDNPNAPTSESDFNGRSLGDAVAWDNIEAWTGEATHDSQDFSSILQTHLSRAGWSSGNALIVFVKDNNSDTSAFRRPYSYDGSAAKSAELIVSYTTPIAPSVNETVNLTESVTVELETLPGQVSAHDILALSEFVSVELDVGPINVSETINVSDVVSDLIVSGPIEPDLSESLQLTESVTVALDILIDSVWLSPIKENAKERYYFTLTGDADATTDIEIPISSFQARKRTGESTYLSVVIPDYTGQAAAVAARPNGEMYIELALILNGTETVREEILRVDLEDIQLAQGGRNRSIILTGHKTQSFTRQIMTLDDSIYRSVSGGLITHRFAKCDPYLNPGDLVTIGTDTIVVDYVTYTVSTNFKVMEIKEV